MHIRGVRGLPPGESKVKFQPSNSSSRGGAECHHSFDSDSSRARARAQWWAYWGRQRQAPAQPPPRARLFGRGVGLQLANPNALVYFGGLLPAYLDLDKSLVVQGAVMMLTITLTELIGLVVYATAADWLAQHFASTKFALYFFRCAALSMAGSATFAVYATWTSIGR